MNAQVWLPVLEAMQKADTPVFGVIATRREVPEGQEPRVEDLYETGCLCRVHRVHREGEQLQVLLEGLQRFRVRQWTRPKAPMTAAVRYFPDHVETQSADEKAYAVAIINMIKELIPLNPLYGEELKVFSGPLQPESRRPAGGLRRQPDQRKP